MTVTASPPVPIEAPHERLVPLRVKAAMAAIALGLVGFICYGIGTNHGTEAVRHIATGRAFASPYQVGVRAGGWSYGFELSSNGLDWYDRRGGLHEGGIPPCLQHGPRSTWIRFGWTTAVGLHGDRWRPVTWVQCVRQP